MTFAAIDSIRNFVDRSTDAFDCLLRQGCESELDVERTGISEGSVFLSENPYLRVINHGGSPNLA